MGRNATQWEQIWETRFTKSFAVEVLRGQQELQGIVVNKTKHRSVFHILHRAKFSKTENFEGFTKLEAIHNQLEMFFTWEFLTNQNVLRNIEKQSCFLMLKLDS